jgi:tripartite-type tricarboxylate transporter receptor subunit TctC
MPVRWTYSSVRTLLLAVALTGVLGFRSPGPALALDYPIRTVTVVVPFPAGGPLDFTARLLAEKLSASLRQPFIVENRAGVAGNLGTEAVAKAPPDGHTLLMVLDTPLTAHPLLYPKLPFDPERDFAPISIVAGFSQMLVVHPSVPVNSLADFVNFARENRVTHGSGGGQGQSRLPDTRIAAPAGWLRSGACSVQGQPPSSRRSCGRTRAGRFSSDAKRSWVGQRGQTEGTRGLESQTLAGGARRADSR